MCCLLKRETSGPTGAEMEYPPHSDDGYETTAPYGAKRWRPPTSKRIFRPLTVRRSTRPGVVQYPPPTPICFGGARPPTLPRWARVLHRLPGRSLNRQAAGEG